MSYTQYWATRMMRGYYAIFQHTPALATDREPYGPIAGAALLPLPVWVGTACLLAGFVVVALRWRQVIASKPYRFILVICIFYLIALWLFNYSNYLKIWSAEAIQARYTYPLMLLLFVLFLQCIDWSVASKKIKALAVAALVPLYVWGGGITGWLVRSDSLWWWDNSVVRSVNETAQSVLHYTVIR